MVLSWCICGGDELHAAQVGGAVGMSFGGDAVLVKVGYLNWGVTVVWSFRTDVMRWSLCGDRLDVVEVAVMVVVVVRVSVPVMEALGSCCSLGS